VQYVLMAPTAFPTARATPAIPRSKSLSTRAAQYVALAVVASAFGGLSVWLLQPASPLQGVVRYTYRLGDGQSLSIVGRRIVAISADGTRMAYVASATDLMSPRTIATRIYMKSMADDEATPIPGTETQGPVSNPTFSPDGRSIVFWSVPGV